VSNNHATEYAYQIEPEDTVKFNNNSCKRKKPCFPMVFPTLICSGRKTTQWKICKNESRFKTVKVKRCVHQKRGLCFHVVEWWTMEWWTSWWRWNERKQKWKKVVMSLAERCKNENRMMMKVWRENWRWNCRVWACASLELAFSYLRRNKHSHNSIHKPCAYTLINGVKKLNYNIISFC
jgi:hypothetical protein